MRAGGIPQPPQPRESCRPSKAAGLDRLKPSREMRDFKTPPLTEARLLKRREDPRFAHLDVPPPIGLGAGRLGKVGVIGIVVLAMGAAAFGGRYLYQAKERPASAIEPENISRLSAPAPPPLTIGEQAEIKDLVKDFHRARSPEAKARFVVDGVMMLERLASFYSTHPLEPTEVALDPTLTLVEVNQVPYFCGAGRYADGRAFQYHVTRREGEFLLDWASIAEYSEMDWIEFVVEQPTAPIEFRVLVEQTDQIPKSESDPSRYLAFKLRPSSTRESSLAYADITTLAGGQLKRVFSQEELVEPLHLTLKLAYETSPGDDPKILITELVRTSWVEPSITQ